MLDHNPCRRWLSGRWCRVQHLIQPHSAVDHMQLSIFQKENKLCFSSLPLLPVTSAGGAVAAVIMWGWRFIDLYWVSRWAQAHYTALCCSDKAGDWHQWPTQHSRQTHPPPVTYLTMQSQREIMAPKRFLTNKPNRKNSNNVRAHFVRVSGHKEIGSSDVSVNKDGQIGPHTAFVGVCVCVCVQSKDAHDGVTHYVSHYEGNRVTRWLRIVKMEEISPSCQPINYKLDTLWTAAKRIYHNAWNPGRANEWFPRKPTGDGCFGERFSTSTAAATIFSSQCNLIIWCKRPILQRRLFFRFHFSQMNW